MVVEAIMTVSTADQDQGLDLMVIKAKEKVQQEVGEEEAEGGDINRKCLQRQIIYLRSSLKEMHK